MTEPITFDREEEILDYFMEHGVVWMALVAADSWPYILTSTEHGDVFTQTFPEGDEDGEPNGNGTKWLHEHEQFWYPVRLVAADPEPSSLTPHDDGCRDFYAEYGEPDGGVCKVCGESTEPSDPSTKEND